MTKKAGGAKAKAAKTTSKAKAGGAKKTAEPKAAPKPKQWKKAHLRWYYDAGARTEEEKKQVKEHQATAQGHLNASIKAIFDEQPDAVVRQYEQEEQALKLKKKATEDDGADDADAAQDDGGQAEEKAEAEDGGEADAGEADCGAPAAAPAASDALWDDAVQAGAI